MAIRSTEWLAGLFEGEACFTGNTNSPHPQIQIKTTDLDVMQDVSDTVGKPVREQMYYRRNNHTPQYRVCISGPDALVWMRKLYPHMGSRRRARIEELLAPHGGVPMR